MPQLTDNQIAAMNETLCTVMNMRLDLTRIEKVDKKTCFHNKEADLSFDKLLELNQI